MLTERAIQIRAKRESWPSVKRSGRGGGNVYPLATLPEDVRAAITLAQAKAVETVSPPALRAKASNVVVPDWSWSKAKAKARL
ncbi:MAG: DNA-binding protein, partial [Humidesulfovibrio sp.]|nr:DNA-binding protein [Humidesulfovibrio sp.]